jgi:protein involved in polysaccharide export with SLBB domain
MIFGVLMARRSIGYLFILIFLLNFISPALAEDPLSTPCPITGLENDPCQSPLMNTADQLQKETIQKKNPFDQMNVNAPQVPVRPITTPSTNEISPSLGPLPQYGRPSMMAPERPAGPSSIETSFAKTETPHIPTRSLTQYGYNLFSLPAGTFAPLVNAPVGPDYVLGPGDTLIINIWGMVEYNLQLTIDREGKVYLPKAGPVSLWGLTLADAKELIHQQISHVITQFHLSVSMGMLRTIRVFVLGETAFPGAYEISSVSTISNALFMAGGPTKVGTLRHIQHFRKNQKLGEIDLYDFLLKGDKSHDARIESGDVIFIPPIGQAVGITGNVKRPAIYELANSETVSDLISLAGGITPLAYLEKIQIERIKEHREKILMDLNFREAFPQPLQDGDLVKVFAIHGRIKDTVSLEGFVQHPGEYAYKPGIRISDLLTDEELLPESYLNRAEVVRLRPDFTNEILPFSIEKIKTDDPNQNLSLLPGDRIVISSEIRKRPSVTLAGEVVRPGSYAIASGEKLSSVIRRAGGFSQSAYLQGAVFTRKKVAEREEIELTSFVKVQETHLLAESSALAAGGISQQDAVAEQASLNQRRELLKLLSSKVTLGRVVVHLDQPEKLEGSPDNLSLEDGDTLSVPSTPTSVVVLGSVRNATGILYKEGTNVDYYLRHAGGASEEANPKGLYLIKADGSAEGDISMRTPMDRGDTLVVPISTDPKYRPISFWRDFATILGQFGLTLAAIKVIF